MTKLFISYSRKDRSFAERLVGKLSELQADVWIDWEDIPPSIDWWQEIETGIEESDAFIFLLSPNSITSKVCGEEVAYAVKNGKRLIPIVVRDVDPEDTLPEISKLNWIFFHGTKSFTESFQKLDIAIHVDFEWVQLHREIQVKALKWESRKYENSFLLRGRELADAERHFHKGTKKDPAPTDLQRVYISKSRLFAVRQRRLLITISSTIVVIFLGILLYSPFRTMILKWKAKSLGDVMSIKGGEAILGDNDLAESGNALVSDVYNVNSFQIEVYEVTYERYSLCVSSKVCTSPNGVFDENEDKNRPVAHVNVEQAMEFCAWIDRRLPTDVEWERAARYIDGRRWPWGSSNPPSDNLYAALNYERINPDQMTTQDVGIATDGVSVEGVYDLIGNVWEWTCTSVTAEPNDCWSVSFDSPKSASFIIRGGGANIPPSKSIVSAYRESAAGDYSLSPFIGFRCVDAP